MTAKLYGGPTGANPGAGYAYEPLCDEHHGGRGEELPQATLLRTAPPR
jgi:hypothetical protein